MLAVKLAEFLLFKSLRSIALFFLGRIVAVLALCTFQCYDLSRHNSPCLFIVIIPDSRFC